MYIVEGGIFKTTEFLEVTPGTEESYGPFESYELAKRAWIRGTFNPKIDICNHRLLIKERESF